MRNEQWIGMIVLLTGGGFFFGMMFAWFLDEWRSKEHRERQEFNRDFKRWKDDHGR